MPKLTKMDTMQLYLRAQSDKGFPLHNLERWYAGLQAQREAERRRIDLLEDRMKTLFLFVLRTSYSPVYLHEMKIHGFEFHYHFATDEMKKKYDELWDIWKP